MLRKSKCLDKWSRQEPVLGITLHLIDPAVYELCSMLDFDLIWVDMEHHAHSLQTVSDMMRAARVGTSDLMVRPGKGEFMEAARLMEAGAQAIMYPRCDSVGEAQAIVESIKFPPMGERGLDACGPDAMYGLQPLKAYLEHVANETFLVVQIEDEQGMKNLDAIAETDGVDVLFFGPGDYSIRQGFAGDFSDPRYWEAVERVASAAKKAGKIWGTPAFSPDHAAELISKGALLVTYTSDLSILRRQFISVRESFSSVISS